ncbi:MAG: hypothetical protein JWQ76_879 [Ramlibacter sp.]|nr:hypothetical protein [Ramlibacter sp.]
MSETTVLIDFGSTFTKVTAIDCASAAVIGRAQSPTTIRDDVGIGLELALQALVAQTGRPDLRNARRLASSSAAGGLRMVVCGLVPRLTSEAARRAALGAGAKIIGTYSYRLTKSDVKKIEASAPDIVLLSGGTDGGEGSVILANAEALAASGLRCPFVLAANRSVNEDAAEMLREAGREVHTASNVMPEFGRLEVDSARKAIREVFIQRIVHAKGLDAVQATFDAPVMPTPMAVLLGAELLARGHQDEQGFGDLLLVDVGGATTDVNSVAKGDPTDASLVLRGLPEPYAKRTVEGDLGMRFNAANILEAAGENVARHSLAHSGGDGSDVDLLERVQVLGTTTQALPQDDAGHRVDTALGRTAVEIAVARHAGTIEHVHMPDGDVAMQVGKDLRNVQVVVGTGGILAYGRNPRYILEGAVYSAREPLSLRPRNPRFLMDSLYVFYAAGLLVESRPDVAIRLLKQTLTAV